MIKLDIIIIIFGTLVLVGIVSVIIMVIRYMESNDYHERTFNFCFPEDDISQNEHNAKGLNKLRNRID